MARYPLPANAGPYRTADNLRHHWIGSPVIPSSNDYPHFADFPFDTRRDVFSSEAINARRYFKDRRRERHMNERSRERRPWHWFKTIFHPRSGSDNAQSHSTQGTDYYPVHRPLQPSDWRSHAYWPRPTFSTTEPISPNIADPQAAFHDFQSPYGSPPPERWMPGFQHEYVPPRPPLGRASQPGDSFPSTRESQLNPFLQHRLLGVPPLYFDIGRPPSGIVFAEPQVTIPLEESDRVQPATFPLVTHMHIIGVGDDTAPTFPWPVMVHNPTGITCQDVFKAIFSNFQEHINADEYNIWTERQKDRCTRAYHLRVENANAWNPELTPPIHDGLRRIDYMGDRVMFRGLEPSPDGDRSWIMFVGPP